MAEGNNENLLYGLPHSLYTGIARSYLRSQGIPFCDVSSHHPDAPLHRILAVLIHYYGSQTLLRHAMHYRWSFLDQQHGFLYDAFSNGAPAGEADILMQRM